MSSDKIPQFVITLCVLGGFAAIVFVYMLVDMNEKNAEVMKAILTSAGTACVMVLGFWFSPSK